MNSWTRRAAEGQVQVCALRDKECEEWYKHIVCGHIPFRRESGECLRAAGRDRPRTRQEHPDAYALSLDIAGPFSPGQDQDQGHPKYFVVAVITVPFKDERPLVWGWRPKNSSQDEEQPAEDTLQELQPRLDEGLVDNPFKGDDGAVITEEEINKCTFKQEIENLKSTNVKRLTSAAPLLNRKEQTVLTAVAAKLYAWIKALQIAVLSVKTDRAKEFVSKRFREWVANRDILQNFTAGDEPTGNTRAEIEIGILRNSARALLKPAGLQMGDWPTAIQHSAEERHRGQLRGMGLSLPRLLPYGANVMVRTKTWHRVADD